MENILLENIELVSGLVVTIIGLLFIGLKKLAVRTENKIDDKIVEIIESYKLEEKAKEKAKEIVEEKIKELNTETKSETIETK